MQFQLEEQRTKHRELEPKINETKTNIYKYYNIYNL